jgi:hypothetical protein
MFMEAMLPKITDYWDQHVEAVSTMAGGLASLSYDARERTIADLEAAIARHLDVIPDSLMISVAAAVADDLYKAACWIDRWDDSINAYLSATAGTFWEITKNRGYSIHYLVDNTFESLERPLHLFPGWFASAGLVYACPYAIATRLLESDGGSERELDEQLPRYDDEARSVTEQLLVRCRAEGRHYLLLDLDYREQTFQSSLAERGRTGVITVFRNQPADTGTTVSIWPPT